MATGAVHRYCLGGLFLGVFFGVMLSLSCVSIKVCPCNPVSRSRSISWSESIQLVGAGNTPADTDGLSLGAGETNDPLVTRLLLGPMAVFVALGFLLGGFGLGHYMLEIKSNDPPNRRWASR